MTLDLKFVNYASVKYFMGTTLPLSLQIIH